MTSIHKDLTLDIRSEDGSDTQYFQDDENAICKVFDELASPKLFSQPLLTLTSQQSVSAIPSRTIALILARTPNPPPLRLPLGWLDFVEIGIEAFHDQTPPIVTGVAEPAGLPGEPARLNSLVEIHTVGDWRITLKLQTAVQATIPEQRRTFAQLVNLPVLSFRLEEGGLGFINSGKITRVTIFPAIAGMTDVGLPANLLRCVRA